MSQTVKTVRNIWFITSICLLIGIVITSSYTVYYYQAYVTMEKQYKDTAAKLKDVSLTVNILVKYSNGTKTWYNQTLIPVGWSLFNATKKATHDNIEYLYPENPFITAINGVKQIGALYWMWYTWNATSSSWKIVWSGANDYILRDKDTIAWYLVDTSTYPNIPSP